MQPARINLGRVARSTLFAVGAAALNDCSANAIYGFSCMVDNDACSGYDAVSGDEFNPIWGDSSEPADANEMDAEADADASTDALSDVMPDSASD